MHETEVLDAFADAPTLAARVEALKELVRGKPTKAVTADPRFERGVQALVSAAGAVHQPYERLLALASLGRVSGAVRALEPRLAAELGRVLEAPLDPLASLENPDDREYVALACRQARTAWGPSYVAQGAVEDGAERVRAACVLSLLEATPSLDAALSLLCEAMERWRPGTDNPLETAGKRLRRLLGALEEQLASTRTAAGPESGVLLSRLIQLARRERDGSVTTATATEVADGTMRLVDLMLRSRFSLVADPAAYEATRSLRPWFSPVGWQHYLERSEDAKRVASDLTEALTLLARQGRSDSKLLDVLVLVAGSKDNARARTRAIAQSNPDIPPEIAAWLLGEEPRAVLGQVEGGPRPQAQPVRGGEHLALLLRDAQKVWRLGQQVRSDLMSELTLLAPNLARPLGRYLAQSSALADDVRGYCEVQSLRLRGSPGDIEEYSALQHQLANGEVGGLRWVRVLEPAVIEVREGGTSFTVLRALAEPVPEGGGQ